MQDLFQIDGRTFHVGVESLERAARIQNGPNEGSTLSGLTLRDLVGTYYDYTLSLSAWDGDPADYDALYELLTAPKDSHIVALPYGQGVLRFSAYITAVTDALVNMDGENQWGGLQVQFYAMSPQRYPG